MLEKPLSFWPEESKDRLGDNHSLWKVRGEIQGKVDLERKNHTFVYKLCTDLRPVAEPFMCEASLSGQIEELS